jgi:hypothetical protein
MSCMKNLFDAASSLTALVNIVDKNVEYQNLSEMNQELLETMQQNKTLIKGPQQSNTDQSDSDDDDSDKGKGKEEEDYEVPDNNSTDLEHLSGTKNKKRLIMSVDDSENSNSTDDDNRANKIE